MKSWIVIPIKTPEACKTRLRSVLGDTARRELVADMLEHVVTLARRSENAEVWLLGPSRHGLDEEISLLADPGAGLNEALAAAVDTAIEAGVQRLAFVSGDLPLLAAEDVAALLHLYGDEIGIAPDRQQTGTNALSLPLPAAAEFEFGYGPGSFEHHRHEAQRLQLPVRLIRTPGLASDIDTPDDLALLS